MLWEQQKRWRYYDTGLMATEYEAALFLKKWFRNMVLKGQEASFFEIADLQRYKLYKTSHKVRTAMRERTRIPFVFLAGKN